MNSDNIIQTLKTAIENSLLKLIDGPYVYTDLPYYNNTGDILIWEGTKEFLKKVSHQCIETSSLHGFRLKSLPRNAVILLQGGGNFGDLWRRHQEFRLYIMKNYPGNKIIILPQSVCYTDENTIKKDAEKMAEHKNAHIFARDEISYDLLKKHFKNNIGLIPDMAFCIDKNYLKKYALAEKAKALFIKRNDKEFAEAGYEDFFKNMELPLDIKDWPAMEKEIRQHYILRKYFMRKFVPRFMLNRYADKYFRRAHIKSGVEFISSYREIYTTRLHGAILSFLLGKKCRVFDNNYGKNSSFINTWLKNSPDIKMI